MIGANLKGMESYIAGVRGMVEALDTPGVKGDFIGKVMNETRKQFMFDTIAANEAGTPTIKHAFEWGDTAGSTSSTPLFKLTKDTVGKTRMLSYTFLPSTKPVPPPDPKFGIDADTLSNLRPQLFPMKAWVMENQSKAEILPKRSKMLLVPNMRSKRGFVLASSKTVNPGGAQATGGFANWWNAWFDSKAAVIAQQESVKMEEFLQKTGQRIVRWAAGTSRGGRAVGGQFAKQQALDFGYISGERSRWKGNVEKALRNFYGDDEDWNGE